LKGNNDQVARREKYLKISRNKEGKECTNYE
jgi:hypothetical protein